jgi:hypothetical protein
MVLFFVAGRESLCLLFIFLLEQLRAWKLFELEFKTGNADSTTSNGCLRKSQFFGVHSHISLFPTLIV